MMTSIEFGITCGCYELSVSEFGLDLRGIKFEKHGFWNELCQLEDFV